MSQAGWDKIIGHGQVIKLVKFWKKEPAFAYLITGPAHVGKNTIAELLVKEFAEMDNDSSLRLHPDIFVFEPEEGKRDIAVKTVRELRTRLYEKPQIAKKVIAFLPNMERLNTEGFNALLKIMEEPPAHAVFIAVAENISKIPDTILSRVVRVSLGLVPKHELISALESRGVQKNEAEVRAEVARGRPGLAINFDDILAEYRSAADAYVMAVSLGARLLAVERIHTQCAEAEDGLLAWQNSLNACGESLRGNYLKMGFQSVILGQGIADAYGAIGSAISPRIYLEAAAINVKLNYLVKPNFLPKTFPLSLTI
ncbi:AAA family ATPase [Patescibacteria group bacterium]|nr:AAA family ATPase [Patescibacteria group bacterium]